MFIESMKFGKPQSVYLLPENLEQIKMPTVHTQKKGTVIIPLRYDEDLFIELQKTFPTGESQKENGIFIYKIDG